MKGGGLMIALGPSKDGKGEEVEAEETDEPSEMEDAARTLVEALGLKPDRLDMSAVAMALENFVACCGREEEDEGLPVAGVSRNAIIAKARRRANMENSTFVSPAEAVEMCDASAQALMDMLREAFGQAYASSEDSFTTVPGTKLYTLNARFLTLLGIYIVTSTVPGVVALSPFMERDVAGLLSDGILGYAQPEDSRYRLTGTQGLPGTPGTAPLAKIEILPVPKVAFQVTYRFIPILNTDPSPTVDNWYEGVNGWEEWIAWDLARKWLKKEESDWSGAAEECARLEARIRASAGQRDQGMPEQVTDVRGGIRELARARMGGYRRRWRV